MNRARTMLAAILIAAVATGGTAPLKAVNAKDRHFMRAATMGNIAEIKLGELAAMRGNSQFIRAYGKRMSKDHGVALQELRQLGKTEKVSLPKSMAPEHRAAWKHLSGLKGEAFDNAYKVHMMEDHNKAIALYKATSKNAANSNVRNYASKYAPIVEMHHMMLKDGKMDM